MLMSVLRLVHNSVLGKNALHPFISNMPPIAVILTKVRTSYRV